ncbi:hypothetical protein M2408_001971 [Sphingobacterium sp. BIGb0165]|nr:hypothetical protein [Sphingobacterium sp. BIGb0165]
MCRFSLVEKEKIGIGIWCWRRRTKNSAAAFRRDKLGDKGQDLPFIYVFYKVTTTFPTVRPVSICKCA